MFVNYESSRAYLLLVHEKRVGICVVLGHTYMCVAIGATRANVPSNLKKEEENKGTCGK